MRRSGTTQLVRCLQSWLMLVFSLWLVLEIAMERRERERERERETEKIRSKFLSMLAVLG